MHSSEYDGYLAGRLIDRRSSLPLVESRISLVGHDGRTMFAKTDQNGEFNLKLAEGAYDLAISARGYLSMLVRGIGVLKSERIEIIRALVPGEGAETSGEQATAVGGLVYDRLKEAISNLIVDLRSEDHKQATRTDRKGVFMFHGVPKGTYELYFRNADRAVAKQDFEIPVPRGLVRIEQKIDMMV